MEDNGRHGTNKYFLYLFVCSWLGGGRKKIYNVMSIMQNLLSCCNNMTQSYWFNSFSNFQLAVTSTRINKIRQPTRNKYLDLLWSIRTYFKVCKELQVKIVLWEEMVTRVVVSRMIYSAHFLSKYLLFPHL